MSLEIFGQSIPNMPWQDRPEGYTVVQPATVPLRPSKPSKPMILIGFVFLAGVGSVGWILFIKDLLKGWKKQTTI